ncbi:hypothetical protein CVS40_1045 [Lucilia cuprina]|nr:hypothetical protein CVS40_1045 [Lucilia cuprina]
MARKAKVYALNEQNKKYTEQQQQTKPQPHEPQKNKHRQWRVANILDAATEGKQKPNDIKSLQHLVWVQELLYEGPRSTSGLSGGSNSNKSTMNL